MAATVGHRSRVAVAALSDTVFDMLGDMPKGNPPATTATRDRTGLPELGARIYNNTGGTLTRGTLVYLASRVAVGGRGIYTVTKSQAGVTLATYVVSEDIADLSTGMVTKGVVLMTTLDTSLSSIGATVYAHASTAGALTLTASAQPVGKVETLATLGVVAFDLWNSGLSSAGGGLNIPDSGTLTFGTGGTDVVFTADGTDLVITSTGDVVLADSVELAVGTGKDLKISHDGTNTSFVGANGDIIIDNTDTNDQIILRVGTDTTATGVEIRNNSDAAMWNFRPTSATAGSLKGSDASALVLGDGDDIAIAWDATKLAVTQATTNSAIHLGVSGAGIDLNLFGDTVGRDMTWDQSADSLIFGDSAKVVFGTGSDITFLWDGTDLLVSQALADSIIKWGVDGAGINHVFYGDTAALTLTWDQTNDQLLFADSTLLSIGSGAGAAGDITFSWNGTKMLVGQLTANSAIDWGVDGAGIDMVLYGDTASVNATWDQSADSFILNDNAKLVLGTGLDDTVVHNGTLTTWTHTTGDLIIDSTDVDDQIVLRLGTNTSATGFEVRSDDDTVAFSVEAGGIIRAGDGMWTGAPSPANPDPSIAHVFFRDFIEDEIAATGWVVTEDDAADTQAVSDTQHGMLVLTQKATTDNDGGQVVWAQETFKITSGKKLWFEARIRCPAGDATNLDFFVGIAEAEDLTGVADNMPANGIGFKKDDGDANIDLSSSDGGSDTTQNTVGTLVNNTWIKLGFVFNGGASGVGTITPYVDGVAGTSIVCTYATMAEQAAIFMIRNGDATTTQVLNVDYVKIVTER